MLRCFLIIALTQWNIAICIAEPTQGNPAWIVQQIAMHATENQLPFVEFSTSTWLKKPLRIVGILSHPNATTLQMSVTMPYQQVVTIHPNTVEISRPGRPLQTIPISRIPELAEFQAGLLALVSNHWDYLVTHYRMHAQGSEKAWELVLNPIAVSAGPDAIKEMQFYGNNADLRCIVRVPAKGPPHTMILGQTALQKPTSDASTAGMICRGTEHFDGQSSNDARIL